MREMNEHDAIMKLYSSVVTIRDDVAYDKDGNEVSYDATAVQAEIDANEYKEKRQHEYPSIADQLDKIYHNGIDAWKVVIKATKDKYPKG
tara:strand:- start:54 stop:323 length:270 start_codon:yes stop_codon:yes gene_type:complete